MNSSDTLSGQVYELARPMHAKRTQIMAQERGNGQWPQGSPSKPDRAAHEIQVAG